MEKNHLNHLKNRKNSSDEGSKSKKKGWIVAVVSLLVFILFLLSVGVIVKTVIRHKAQSQIMYQLETIDRHLAKGYYSQAQQLLDDLKDFSLDFDTSKKIIKRVYQIAQKKDNYSHYLEYCQLASRHYPKERESHSLYVHALLKTNQFDKAWQVAEEHFQGSGILPSLLAEASLRSQNTEKLQRSALDAFSRSAVALAVDEDPNGYQYIMDRINHEGLVKNYILSLAYSGDIQGAHRLFDEKIGKLNPVLGSYLAYDAGDLEKAYSYAQMLDKEFSLENNRQWYLYLADLSLQLGVKNEAAALYADFIKSYPNFSSVPYYNLSNLYKGSPEAISYMEKGVAAFPHSAQLNLKLAEDFVAIQQPQKAKTVLENFLKIDANNIEGILAYQYLISHVAPERFIGVLWNLYNHNKGENEKIPQVFLWYLTGLSDWAEMDRVIRHCEKDYGERSWIDFYKGISAIFQENYQLAYDSFKSCTTRVVRESGAFHMGYHPYYNCALLSLYFGYPDRALEEIESARNFIDWEDDKLAAAVHIVYGRIYSMKRDMEKAARSFQLAHDLDPANIEAISYLDYINSGIKQ